MSTAKLFWWLPGWVQTLYWRHTHWLVVRKSQARHGGAIVHVAYAWEYKPDLKIKAHDNP